MERKTKGRGLLVPARRLGGWGVGAVILTGCMGSMEPGETGSGIDDVSGSATGRDAASRDATVHPTSPQHRHDAGRDGALDADVTSDDSSTDGLSTSDAQVDARSDVTVISDAGDAGTLDSGTQGEAGAPDAAIEATTTDGAPSDVNAPTDAADGGVVADAENVDSGVPSCLVPGTYALPITGTTCSVSTQCTQEMGSTSLDLTLTIVDDPVAGWEVWFVGNSSFIGSLTPLPIVLTASGFAVDDTFLFFDGVDATEELSLSVDCPTGIATFSGNYEIDSPTPCVPLCNNFYVNYNSFSGTCSNCL